MTDTHETVLPEKMPKTRRLWTDIVSTNEKQTLVEIRVLTNHKQRKLSEADLRALVAARMTRAGIACTADDITLNGIDDRDLCAEMFVQNCTPDE